MGALFCFQRMKRQHITQLYRLLFVHINSIIRDLNIINKMFSHYYAINVIMIL